MNALLILPVALASVYAVSAVHRIERSLGLPQNTLTCALLALAALGLR